jgi:hypothetical protein
MKRSSAILQDNQLIAKDDGNVLLEFMQTSNEVNVVEESAGRKRKRVTLSESQLEAKQWVSEHELEIIEKALELNKSWAKTLKFFPRFREYLSPDIARNQIKQMTTRYLNGNIFTSMTGGFQEPQYGWVHEETLFWWWVNQCVTLDSIVVSVPTSDQARLYMCEIRKEHINGGTSWYDYYRHFLKRNNLGTTPDLSLANLSAATGAKCLKANCANKLKNKIKSESLAGKIGNQLDKPSVVLKSICNYSMIFDEVVDDTTDKISVTAEDTTVPTDTIAVNIRDDTVGEDAPVDMEADAEVEDGSGLAAKDAVPQHVEVNHLNIFILIVHLFVVHNRLNN